MSAESRAHPRYALEVDAEIRTSTGVIPARTKDVSRGGLCCTTRNPLALGQDVSLNLSLVFDEQTFSEPLLVRARVVWCTGLGEGRWQIGTTFLGLTAENRAYLEMFLRYLKEGLARQAEEQQANAKDDDDDEEVFG
jgi:Tfp pilus assembly protein PilZ